MKTTTLCIGLTLAVAGTAHGQCIEGDINGDGVVNGIDLSYVIGNWGNQCPIEISAVWPPSGPPTGGTVITITGSQLGGVLSVIIGGVPATDVVSHAPTLITAVTPPTKSIGPADVVVTTTAGSATLEDGFVYSTLQWALVLESAPNPAVITNPDLREQIVATGLPWRVRDIASGIEMLLVPPGTFAMGCSPSVQYACRDNEFPVHQVTISQGFYLGRFEVTQAEWATVMGSNPSWFSGAADSPLRPVEAVSWNMCMSFLAATDLRLPTEAEWEYACRAGTQLAINLPPAGTNDDSLLDLVAWYMDNSADQTHPVGQKLANGFGLHDMHGNVWEYVQDWFAADYYMQSPAMDPTGPLSGQYRGIRGGSWYLSNDGWRSSDRGGVDPEGAYTNWGFRVARNP